MLASSPPGTWSQVRVRPRQSNNVRVEFRFYPAYARSAWGGPGQPPPARVTRGGRPLPKETLLLDDVMFIENQSAFVRAWLIPAKKKDYYHLRVELVAPARISRNARVSLCWGQHNYPGEMRAGQLFFENISPPDFSRYLNNLPSRHLHLAFEFENADLNGKPKSNGHKNGNGNGNGNGKH